MAIESIEDHFVILGWSDRVKRIIHELRNDEHEASGDLKPILVVTTDRSASIDLPFERVYVIYGQLADPRVLERANLERASTVLIPALDPNNPNQDGESVFALLAVLSVCPKAQVCIELVKGAHTEVLERISRMGLFSHNIEFVAVESISERLLAQSAINPGVTRVYDHLISFTEESNEVYVVDLPPAWIGKSFRDLAGHSFERGIILIGYESAGVMGVNPLERGYIFKAGDRAWFIGYNKADVLKVVDPARLKFSEQ